MSNLSLRVLHAFLWGGILTVFYWGFSSVNEVKQRRSSPLMNYIAYVPGLFLFAPIMTLLLQKHRKILFLHGILQLLPELFLFTLVLSLLAPRLRRRYSAQSCADLWILPGMLTHAFLYSWAVMPEPWLKLRLPRFALWLLLGLWFAGFCGVLGWKLLEHLRFRAAILRRAEAATPAERSLLEEVWAELDPDGRHSRRIKKLKLVRSPAVSSPLTVGLFERSLYVVLPMWEYSEEELWLIFRHESIHLLRDDNWIKFSTAFLCAAGWCIPSLWVVMRRASEDLELCCDELATSGMRKAARQEYAALILDSAGTEKGFTTCLSASARGLRYRLRRILRRRRSKSAVPLIGVLTVLFLFLFGTVGLELDVGTVGTEFLDRESGSWHVAAVDLHRDGDPCEDPAVLAAVEDYLSDLELTRPLWAEYQKKDAYGDAIVMLSDESGTTAELRFDGDEVYFRLTENPDPTPRYRIFKGLDLAALRRLLEEGKL